MSHRKKLPNYFKFKLVGGGEGGSLHYMNAIPGLCRKAAEQFASKLCRDKKYLIQMTDAEIIEDVENDSYGKIPGYDLTEEDFSCFFAQLNKDRAVFSAQQAEAIAYAKKLTRIEGVRILTEKGTPGADRNRILRACLKLDLNLYRFSRMTIKQLDAKMIEQELSRPDMELFITAWLLPQNKPQHRERTYNNINTTKGQEYFV